MGISLPRGERFIELLKGIRLAWDGINNMHDPMTVAHEITIGQRTLITIWHVDPETDGTDDSCGWFQPHLTEQDLTQVEKMVKWDLEFPFYTSQRTVDMAVDDPKYPNLHRQLVGDCLGYVAEAWQRVAWYKGRRHLTAAEWWTVVNLGTNPYDNLRDFLADPDERPEERARRFLFCVMRQYLRHHRPWWRHPRWHIHHWQFQVHFMQALKRWLFSRCADCGERFTWGYAPISGSNWSKSGTHYYHHDCYNRVAMKMPEIDTH